MGDVDVDDDDDGSRPLVGHSIPQHMRCFPGRGCGIHPTARIMKFSHRMPVSVSRRTSEVCKNSIRLSDAPKVTCDQNLSRDLVSWKNT
jgi:hypothetical protein